MQIAPPLPPPGVPAWAGLAQQPTARLSVTRLFTRVIGVRSPLIAPPLEQVLPWPLAPPNVLCTMATGSWWRAAYEASRSSGVAECWASTRIAPPPRSGPLEAQVQRSAVGAAGTDDHF